MQYRTGIGTRHGGSGGLWLYQFVGTELQFRVTRHLLMLDPNLGLFSIQFWHYRDIGPAHSLRTALVRQCTGACDRTEFHDVTLDLLDLQVILGFNFTIFFFVF